MRLFTTLLFVLATTLLWGCDQQRIEKLEVGVSTEADVRKQFGDPVGVVEKADGAKVFSYPRQPEGWTNVEIRIGADGKMSSLRQQLTAENFALVQPGLSQDEVRGLLGRHAKTQNYPGKPDEEVWEWFFMAGQDKKIFSVIFSRQGQVLRTEIRDDERQTMPGGK